MPQNSHSTYIKVITLFFMSIALTLSACTRLNEPGKHFIAADNPAFSYQGRIDFSDPAKPVVIWQASTVELEFSGTSLKLGFSGLVNQVYFDVELDGEKQRVGVKNGLVALPFSLASGWHKLRLFKRSEASKGHVVFRGISIDEGASVRKLDVPHYATRFIFYGDSITVGSCNEDGNEDQWEDFSTHNSALSYAAMVARHFNADYRNIAASGTGISVGFEDYTIDQFWNRYYPEPKATLAQPEAFAPNVVFLNFGENDIAYPLAMGSQFPTDFVSRYIQLVTAMRKTYPDSRIVILRGGMHGGSQNPTLIEPWERVVASLEEHDTQISHFSFNHWHNQHPRVANHKAMADELINWLSVQVWLTAI